MRKDHYARMLFGLPVEQIRFFDELDEKQQMAVRREYGAVDLDTYVYAVKADGELVRRREKRRPLLEVGEFR